MFQKIMKEFEDRSRLRSRELIREKNQGKPLIGYNSDHIPEELIRAAGANTYFMCRGGEPEPPEAVFDGILRFMNPLARSLAGFNALGLDPLTPFADLIVVAQTDTHYGRISEYMEYNGMKIAKVGVPGDWKRNIALKYYADSVRKLVKTVEEITGQPVDMEQAKENFRVSNAINEYLRKIDALRKKDNPPIGFYEFLRLNHYSLTLEPNYFLEKIAEVYEALKDAPGKFAEGAPRVFVAGRAFAIGDYMVPRKFEEKGAVIVAELMDEGLRMYEKDVALDGDLCENFAYNRYREKAPINLFQPSWDERFEIAMKKIKEYNADGAVWYQLVFDEIYDMEYSVWAKWMDENKIPFMKLDTSYTYSREEMGPMITRVESFIDNIKEVK